MNIKIDKDFKPFKVEPTNKYHFHGYGSYAYIPSPLGIIYVELPKFDFSKANDNLRDARTRPRREAMQAGEACAAVPTGDR